MRQALCIQTKVVFVALAVPSMMFTAAEVHGKLRCPLSSWQWGPLLPERRSAFSCCTTEDSIVVIGGTFWTSTDTHEQKKKWLAAVYRLKRDSGRWESLPDFPVPIEYALVVSWNGRIYAVGGQNSDGVRAQTYSIAPNEPSPQWQLGPNLPRPLSRLRGGVWGSKIVAVTDEHVGAESGGCRVTPKILAWDAADPQSKWTEIAAVPEATVGYRAASVTANKLYLFGGASVDSQQQLRLCDKVWRYDLEGDKWIICSPLPTPLRDATAIKLSDRYIVLAGGVEEAIDASVALDEQSRILLSTRCLVYDCDNDRFTAADPLPLAVADHGLAILGDELFVVGGEDSPYRTRTDLVQRCDVQSLVNSTTQRKEQCEEETQGKSLRPNDETVTKVRANALLMQDKSVGVIRGLKTRSLSARAVGY